MNKKALSGHHRPFRMACCLWLLSAIGAGARAETIATATDLGTLGGNDSWAVAVSNTGQVIGVAQRATVQDFYFHAFSWSAAGGMVDLTASFATLDSHVIDVTDDGRVFGNFYTAAGNYRAFTWTAAGGAVEFGTLNGVDSLVTAVSSTGQAIGWSGNDGFSWTAAGGLVNLGNLGFPLTATTPNAVSDAGHVAGHGVGTDPRRSRAFIWTAAGGLVDLGDALPGWPSAEGCKAMDVNGNGEVVGTCGRFDGRRGFYWSAASGMLDVGALHWPLFINDAGQVAGRDSASGQAFYWTRAGGTVYLGALGDTSSEPTGISASGLMAGITVAPSGATRTFVSQGGGPMQRVGLTPGDPSGPTGINAAGHIVGDSTAPANFRGFYWSPDSGAIELPPLDSGSYGYSYSQVAALSDNGRAAGRSNVAGGWTHAVLWTLELDTDGDGIPDSTDPDDDNDGVPDEFDDYPLGRFADAAPGYWAFTFIEALARAGITAGCGGDRYCPDGLVTRAQMAVFLERGMRGAAFSPPPASGSVFLDVAANAFAAGFIEQLYRDGVTSGCGGGRYCPTATVTRAQMAVFLLRARHGRDYRPPAPAGVFADVDTAHWAAAWIERLAAEGITSGCGSGNYCPEAAVTRAQMAVFLVRAFGL